MRKQQKVRRGIRWMNFSGCELIVSDDGDEDEGGGDKDSRR